MFHSHLDEVESTLKGQTYAWRVAAEQKGLEYAFTTYEPVQISDHDDNDDEPEMTYSDISHALSDQAPAAAKAALQMLSEKSPNRLRNSSAGANSSAGVHMGINMASKFAINDDNDKPEMTCLRDQAPAAAKAALQMLSEKSPNRLDMGITMVGICAPTPANPSLKYVSMNAVVGALGVQTSTAANI
jgi:hypothetical protein